MRHSSLTSKQPSVKYCKYLFLFLSGLISINSFAQFSFEYNPDVPVYIGADSMDMPWAGGLNYAQISDFDFDFDGNLDLFIFDRSSNNIRVYTQEGTGADRHYEPVYNAAQYFPENVRYRATLVDYDNDGRKDLFTYGIGGLAVYRNTGNATDGLQWELVTDLLYSQYPNNYSNLYVSSSDIPAIVDVDFDGDLDILTFNIGGQHMEYHQNQSMELYGIPDSLVFVVQNQCWGKFTEEFTTNSVVLNDPNPPCVGGDIADPRSDGAIRPKHAGSTVLALDYDNSGVLDLVLGDVAYTNLVLLINGGTEPNTDSPMISADNAFPSNTTPANMQLFPAAFFVDVDFDGIKDLLVCPNARNVSQNRKSIHFYKNTGTNELPNFVYVMDNFLQREMIEHGTGSVPVFTDINEDGMEDLIVANFFKYKEPLDKESTLAYYRNTGTTNDPVFTLIDENYLDLNLENYGYRSVPTFGDIDGDGDKDLLLGMEDGTLVYYENQSIGNGAIYNNGIINFKDNNNVTITAGGYCFPQLFDLNNDGLLDLILGRKSGEIMYYQNIGTVNNPSFQLQNSALGNIDVSTDNPDGYASPHFFRHEGETYLFVGDLAGRCHFYSDIDGNLAPGNGFTLISNNYAGIETQAYSSFWVNDLNNNTRLELYAGQDLGGIYRFEHDPNSSISVEEIDLGQTLIVYPNPTQGNVTIQSDRLRMKKVELYTINGKIMHSAVADGFTSTLDMQDLPSGIYFLHIHLENGVVEVKKLASRQAR